MIDNNDSRYAFKWLREDYQEIAQEDVEAPWNTQGQETEDKKWSMTDFIAKKNILVQNAGIKVLLSKIS